jgi:TolB-like protein
MRGRRSLRGRLVILGFLICCPGCVTSDVYLEPDMDFGSLQSVAVLPFQNLTGDERAAERVRDTFTGMLLATEAVYVVPPGEVARAVARAGGFPPEGPPTELIKKLSGILEIDAVITGVLREYTAVRSGSTSSNVVSLGLQMIEASSGRIIWSAASTRGGVTVWDRLFGGGGKPMNTVTTRVVNDLLDKLFD